MTLSWVAVNANDGSVIADLPTLRTDGALKQTLMRYESQTASLPLDGAPPNWRQATRKRSVFLVALDEEDANSRTLPLWGGLVLNRTTNAGPDVKVSLATAEAYFDRVYVGDEEFNAVPQNTIVKTLIEKYARTGTKRGIPIRVQIVGGVGAARTRSYSDSADKTLYSVLGDLSGVIGGPEWSVGWEWVDTQRLGLVAYVGDRLGSTPPSGLNPGAQFHLPGSVTAAELVEGYASDSGANDVMAVSSGVDGARPESAHQVDATDPSPRFEYRWTPSTSITDPATLNAHAQRALAAMKDGTVALAITANRQDAPQLGRDWFLGDDVGFDLTAPAWPDGLTGTARAVGWEMTDTTITPLIDVSAIEGID
ncbi:hypothetical protein [Arthrobacter sp. PsM3]|uniref:hypothetical protein n=1 Tax=Arthrobacter sp. PsM3 TaxID=3030531 RepID=UPI00263BC6B2|nr:hypothetical protein [Arthrobacter sp. PsM3]MDN4646459.1 hypothetical protein [Arthrobacter sp. PsM3]